MVFLMLLLSTFFVFGEVLVQTTIASDGPLEEASANILGRHIDWLMNETLGVEKMQVCI